MPLTAVDDEALSTAFAAGEDGALEEAYRRWAPLIHTLALRSLGNRADAEEVTQSVYVAAWRGRATYDPARGSLPGWLVGIARNRVVDHHRSAARHPTPVPALPDAPEPAAVEALAQRLLVADALAELPPDRRRVVELSVVHEHTHAEIAQLTGIPLGTVKSHIRRGVELLRRRLELP